MELTRRERRQMTDEQLEAHYSKIDAAVQKVQTEAISEGTLAYVCQRSLQTNPYPASQPEAFLWDQSWLRAFMEDKE